MLKTSLISLGLLLGATTFASAQAYLPSTGMTGATSQYRLREGRSVYVGPSTNAISPTGNQRLRPGSLAREDTLEEEELNSPAH